MLWKHRALTAPYTDHTNADGFVHLSGCSRPQCVTAGRGLINSGSNAIYTGPQGACSLFNLHHAPPFCSSRVGPLSRRRGGYHGKCWNGRYCEHHFHPIWAINLPDSRSSHQTRSRRARETLSTSVSMSPKPIHSHLTEYVRILGW